MKLKPTLIRIECPACKGCGSIDWGIKCTACEGKGSFKSVVLAPVGYDGVGEVEMTKPLDENLCAGMCDVCYENFPDCGYHNATVPRLGHCKDCKWWKVNNMCGNESFFHQVFNLKHLSDPNGNYIYNIAVKENFGCIHYESKEITK